MVDGTILTCARHCIWVLVPSKLEVPFTAFAGDIGRDGYKNGQRDDARFYSPMGITVDPAGNVVVADYLNHAVRLVSKAGAVRTLAGGCGVGFADGQRDDARFSGPDGVALAANDEIVVADTNNHALSSPLLHVPYARASFDSNESRSPR